jgi:hypothetical protein
MVVRYSTGQVYLLDLEWLRALAEAGDALTPERFIELACAGPLASGLLDEEEVRRAMGGLPPQARLGFLRENEAIR